MFAESFWISDTLELQMGKYYDLDCLISSMSNLRQSKIQQNLFSLLQVFINTFPKYRVPRQQKYDIDD